MLSGTRRWGEGARRLLALFLSWREGSLVFEITDRKCRGGSMKKNPCKGRRVRRRMRGIANGMHRREHDKVKVCSGCGN
jgi:hypothetical protein